MTTSAKTVPEFSRRFSPGRLVATRGALTVLARHGSLPLSLLTRHLSGDWGSVPAEDAALNNAALAGGGRILSSYTVAPDVRIWLITEADRSVTTFLLPSEY